MKSLRQPITQDQSYHQFADTRVWLGTPNAADVYSSLLFVVVGLASAVWLSRRNVAQRWIWLTFFGSVTLVGFGSACYHLNPCDATLFWDRLPMAVAFTSFLAGLLGERAGAALFLPLVVFGVTSVVYWRHTDDLRLYALVQYGPMVAVPLMLWAVPRLRAQAADVLVVLGWYALAKVFEQLDRPMFNLLGVSGHTLKHVASAIGAAWVVRLPSR